MLQNKLHAFVARFTQALESNGPIMTSRVCAANLSSNHVI